MRCSGESPPGAASTCPTTCDLRVDHIVVLANDGRTEERNLQLLCGYCNRVKGRRERTGPAEDGGTACGHVATGVMVDKGLAELTGKRLARYHRGELPA